MLLRKVVISSSLIFSFASTSYSDTLNCGSELFQKIATAALDARGNGLASGKLAQRNTIDSKVLVGSEEIFKRMSEMIEEAKDNIYYQTWKFEPESDAAKSLFDALEKLNNKEGSKKVQVWLMINDVIPDTKRQIREKINKALESKGLHEEKGIVLSFGIFNAKRLGANHARSLSVDGKVALVTGANTSLNFNFGKEGPAGSEVSKGMYDSGYVLRGDIVSVLDADFAQIWNGTTVEVEIKKKRITGPSWSNKLPQTTCKSPVLFTRNKAKALPNWGAAPQSSINEAHLAAFSAATKSLDIITPNMNVREVEKAIVSQLVNNKDIKIRIILGFKSVKELERQYGDHNKNTAKGIYREVARKTGLSLDDLCKSKRLQIVWYSDDGKSAAEGAKPPSSHAKYTNIDNQVTYIGSGNMDRQSWVNSREIGLFVDGKELAQKWHEQVFQPAFERSKEQVISYCKNLSK